MVVKPFKYFLTLLIFFLCLDLKAKEIWILDGKLSTINFEVPVFLAKNVKGYFNEIKGFVEIDTKDKINNKAIFSVKTDSLEINYEKYKTLLLSDTFLEVKNFPTALVDTKKFIYKDDNELKLNAELSIKNINKIVPLEIEIIKLAKELVQIKGSFFFLRKDFNIGVGKWSNNTILKDKVLVKINFFLFKKN